MKIEGLQWMVNVADKIAQNADMLEYYLPNPQQNDDNGKLSLGGRQEDDN